MTKQTGAMSVPSTLSIQQITQLAIKNGPRLLFLHFFVLPWKLIEAK